LPRRRLLGVTACWIGLCAAPLVSSCSAHDAQPPTPPAADPDDPLRATAAAAVQALAVAYDATADRHPALAGRLAPLRAEHVAHLAALNRAAPPSPTGTLSPTASPSGTPAGSPTTGVDVAANAPAAQAALATAEEQAAADRVREAVAAASPDLARQLAAIGASEAAHAALLRRTPPRSKRSEPPTGGAERSEPPTGGAEPTARAGGSAAPSRGQAEIAALQAALAAEHSAIYGYGVLGPRLAGRAQERARSAYAAHRARRDELADYVRDRQADPAAAAPAYELPFPVRDAPGATRLAVRIEEGVAAAYGDLVRASSGSVREFAARVLQEVAVRAAMWRGSSVPFPGMLAR
jgi:hypothetical protein